MSSTSRIRDCSLLCNYTNNLQKRRGFLAVGSQVRKKIPIQEEQKLETCWANKRIRRDDSNLGSIDIPFARLLRYATLRTVYMCKFIVIDI